MKEKGSDMVSEQMVKKAMGEDSDKLLGVDFDDDGLTIWINEPWIWVRSESGCLTYDYDDFTTNAQLTKCVKGEIEEGIRKQ